MLQEIKVDICQKENTTDSNHFARDRRSVIVASAEIEELRPTQKNPFDFELIRVDRFFQSYRIPRRALTSKSIRHTAQESVCFSSVNQVNRRLHNPS